MPSCAEGCGAWGVKERPILFNAEMVRAILDGRKTQTRRVVKPQPNSVVTKALKDGFAAFFQRGGVVGHFRCPHGKPGDRLWVRETWQGVSDDESWKHIKECKILYKATDEHPGFDAAQYAESRGFECPDDDVSYQWQPSIHMPRWASRINLEITGVRVERLGEISEEDAQSEGVRAYDPPAYFTRAQWSESPEGKDDWEFRAGFAEIRHSVHGDWSKNPWVWVIKFRVV